MNGGDPSTTFGWLAPFATSPAVIRAYTAFRNTGTNPDIVLRIDDLLQAMRKDLGNSCWTLNRGDLIKLFITDPENLDVLMKPRKNS